MSQIIIIAALLVAPGLLAPGRQAGQAQARQKNKQAVSDRGRRADVGAVKRYVASVMQRLPVSPGLGVAIIQGDKIILAEGFGYRDVEAKLPVTAETQFYIASTTKSFTATAARMLADEGKLDLDAPIKALFPDLVLKAPLSTEQISVRDLLTHRHGIRNDPIDFRSAYTGQFTTADLLNLLGSSTAPVPTAFRYSNIGYIIAGYAMERATGETWQALVQRKILGPLGMNTTTCYASKAQASGNFALPYLAEEDRFVRLPYKEDNTMHAAGGMSSSAEDLARWLVMNMNAGSFNGRQIVPAASLEEIHSSQINQKRTFYKFNRYAYGLGWNIGTYEGERLIHCFGDFPGFRPHVSFMPAHKIGVVVLANESRDGLLLPDLIACDIYDHILGKGSLRSDGNPRVEEYAAQLRKSRSERKEQALARGNERGPNQPTLDLAAYVGSYSNPQFGTIVVGVKGASLVAQFGNLTSPLEHLNGDTFEATLMPGNPSKLIFKASKGEGVSQLSLIGQTFTRN